MLRGRPRSVRTDADCQSQEAERPGWKAKSSRPPQSGIDKITQPVTQKIEAKNGEQDRKAWEKRVPPALRQILPAFRDHQAPFRRRRCGADAQEAERGGGQDHEA